MIANALKQNRKLMGFHFDGNYGVVNLKGYLIIDEKAEVNDCMENVCSYKRIHGLYFL